MHLKSLLPSLANISLENAMNFLIKKSDSKNILKKLNQKNININIDDLRINLLFVFANNKVIILNQAQDEQNSADVTVKLKAGHILELQDKNKIISMIQQKKLSVDGDLDLLWHFQALLQELQLHSAELLTPLLGDVIAQLIYEKIKKLVAVISSILPQNIIAKDTNNNSNIAIAQPEVVNTK